MKVLRQIWGLCNMLDKNVAHGPQTPASCAVFNFKYAQKGESWRDVCNRVASVLADSDLHYRHFREILLAGKFSPAGRILAGLGTSKHVTPYNCFVSGPIGDSLNGPGSIMDRLSQAAETLRRGGGIGYDFSTIRPRGDKVRSLDSRASGPVSYIEVYNAMAATISSSGERRGAQMGVLRVDHPDIEEFIHAKQNSSRLSTFNLSIAITDEFLEAVQEGTAFTLRFEGRQYSTIDARVLWETIMRSTWDWAEPGVIFIDKVNEWNNLSYCETIGATNPCSEQPLPPFGACLLGSFNLVKYLEPAGPGKRWNFDLHQLAEDVGPVVRAMDNVVDAAIYPLEEQRQEAVSTRRMGLGVMGVANAIEACGLPYGSDEFVGVLEDILSTIKNEAYLVSADLAAEKGAFARYSSEHYSRAPFIRRLRGDVQDRIFKKGLRNSHLTSIAPTGTISFCLDNISSGIEPVFSISGKRVVQMPSGPVTFDTEDYGYKYLGISPKTSAEVSASEHVSVLAAAQKHVDSAVSKTCNVSSDMAWKEFQNIYFNAWSGGAKSCATFQDGGKRGSLLKKTEKVSDCSSGACA
jgi:ribonucleoside-diphosphate reductase alpha chain